MGKQFHDGISIDRDHGIVPLAESLQRKAYTRVQGLIQHQSDDKASALSGTDLVDLIEKRLKVLQDRFQIECEMLCCRGQLDRRMDTLKQRCAQSILQRRHLPAYGGLRNVLLLSCLCEAHSFTHRQEGAQLLNSHSKTAFHFPKI